MRLVIISDTHRMHNKISVPFGDVLIHTGDFSGYGSDEELVYFVQWLSTLSHKVKLIVAGNHDRQLEAKPELADLFGGVAEYLFNSSTEYKGYKFWGSPFQPWFRNWSFNLPRGGEELRKNWAQMPNDTDILLTHSPPHGILDRNMEGEHCGCEFLLGRVKEVKPILHCYGHIHESRGFDERSQPPTTFINATVLDAHYKLSYKPVVIDLDGDKLEVIDF